MDTTEPDPVSMILKVPFSFVACVAYPYAQRVTFADRRMRRNA